MLHDCTFARASGCFEKGGRGRRRTGAGEGAQRGMGCKFRSTAFDVTIFDDGSKGCAVSQFSGSRPSLRLSESPRPLEQ